jgi:uncharacterized protein with von Willebrand factor type A (vWA) domain
VFTLGFDASLEPSDVKRAMEQSGKHRHHVHATHTLLMRGVWDERQKYTKKTSRSDSKKAVLYVKKCGHHPDREHLVQKIASKVLPWMDGSRSWLARSSSSSAEKE